MRYQESDRECQVGEGLLEEMLRRSHMKTLGKHILEWGERKCKGLEVTGNSLNFGGSFCPQHSE